MSATTKTPFVAVFRYHQRPATAAAYDNREVFIDDWANGAFRRENARPYGEWCDAHPGQHPTFGEALDAVGNDLYSLTILESEEEYRRYVVDRDCLGQHNKGLLPVVRAAKELGWLLQDDEADDE